MRLSDHIAAWGGDPPPELVADIIAGDVTAAAEAAVAEVALPEMRGRVQDILGEMQAMRPDRVPTARELRAAFGPLDDDDPQASA